MNGNCRSVKPLVFCLKSLTCCSPNHHPALRSLKPPVWSNGLRMASLKPLHLQISRGSVQSFLSSRRDWSGTQGMRKMRGQTFLSSSRLVSFTQAPLSLSMRANACHPMDNFRGLRENIRHYFHLKTNLTSLTATTCGTNDFFLSTTQTIPTLSPHDGVTGSLHIRVYVTQEAWRCTTRTYILEILGNCCAYLSRHTCDDDV